MVSLACKILKQTVHEQTFGQPWTALLGTYRYSQTQVRSISKKRYKFPEISEDDLEESFVRGSGPGGQKVNKTANCVVLKHIPSGIQVKCQDGRSLVRNREIARDKVRYQLDIAQKGDQSFDALSKKEFFDKRKSENLKAKKLLEKKKAFKEREGLK